MTYSVLANAKIFLGISTGTTGDDALITTLLSRAQTQIESYCKRVFESSGSSSAGVTRYYQSHDIVRLPEGSQWRPAGSVYRGNAQYSWDNWPDSGYSGGQYGHTVLWLGRDLLSVNTLTNGDGTVISSTSYWLEPRNQPPYQWIRLRSDASWLFNTDGEINVNGVWGFSTAAPYDIVQATEQLTAYLYRRRDASTYEIVQSPDGGQISAPAGMPKDIREILVNGGYVRAIRFK